MEILAQLLILLLLTRFFGECAERLGQSASVGEILSGVFLAGLVALFGSQLTFLRELADAEAIEYAATLGIFFLVLLAGIEMEPRRVVEASMGATLVALGGMLLPLFLGFALAWSFLPVSELRFVQAAVVGVVLSITSIPATVKIFEELDLLEGPLGQLVVAAAIIDDVFGLILVAILTALVQGGETPGLLDLAWLLAKIALFFVVTIVIGVHVYPHISRRMREMRAASIEFSALVAAALTYCLLAELLGMHWIMGAFMAGLYFKASRVGARSYKDIKIIASAIAGGVLGPLFFMSIGLRVDLAALSAIPLFILLIVIAGFAGKAIGAGLPALWRGRSRRESAMTGIAMCARGAVELVVLSIAVKAGIFSAAADGFFVANLFSALVIMIVLNTLLATVILRYMARHGGST